MFSAITTPLGAKVSIVDLPEHLEGQLPGGCLMVLTMVDSEDTRHAEIALSAKNMEDLRRHLEVL